MHRVCVRLRSLSGQWDTDWLMGRDAIVRRLLPFVSRKRIFRRFMGNRVCAEIVPSAILASTVPMGPGDRRHIFLFAHRQLCSHEYY